MQLLQLASLCLHGTSLNYMTDCHSVLCWSIVNAVTVQAVALKCIVQLKEAFNLYSDIAKCLPPTLRSLRPLQFSILFLGLAFPQDRVGRLVN